MQTISFWALLGAVSLVGCSSSADDPGRGQTGVPAAGTSGAPSAGNGTGGGPAPSGGSPQGGTNPTSISGSHTGGSANAGGNGGGTSGAGAADCTGSPMPAPTPTQCTLPAGNTAADAALSEVNKLRARMGLSCMGLVKEINASAQKHCDYYQQNKANKPCVADPHGEVATCPGFVADSFAVRMKSAGYSGSSRAEVIAFMGEPASAVALFINSVYHRTPLLSPWIGEMGYGMTSDCDTIDMGQGVKVADTVTAVYPYPGQTGVPIDFHGNREGPTPPQPPSGWPSASPVHLYAKNYEVSTHSVYTKGSCDALAHQWLPAKEEYILYPDKPFARGTEYRVVIAGSRAGQPLTFDWTFETEK